MPTIVGILKFISKINTILRDLKQKTSSFVGISVFMSSWNCVLTWVEHEKSFITSGPGLNEWLGPNSCLHDVGVWYFWRLMSTYKQPVTTTVMPVQWLLLSSVADRCKQFGPRSVGPDLCPNWLTPCWNSRNDFEKVWFKENSRYKQKQSLIINFRVLGWIQHWMKTNLNVRDLCEPRHVIPTMWRFDMNRRRQACAASF